MENLKNKFQYCNSLKYQFLLTPILNLLLICLAILLIIKTGFNFEKMFFIFINLYIIYFFLKKHFKFLKTYPFEINTNEKGIKASFNDDHFIEMDWNDISEIEAANQPTMYKMIIYKIVILASKNKAKKIIFSGRIKNYGRLMEIIQERTKDLNVHWVEGRASDKYDI